MKYISDSTGRLEMRPHFEPIELDQECERIVFAFLMEKFGQLRFPIPTDALEVLIERDAQDLDMYADLSQEGDDVEGVTDLIAGEKPRVRISKRLSQDPRLANRLRTTLTHEFGHVKFHAPLWQSNSGTPDMFGKLPRRASLSCKRENIYEAPVYDWMEWQAGYVCGAVLMPHTLVNGLASQYLGLQHKHRPLDEASPAARGLVLDVARAFQVSNGAARVRLIKLNILAHHRRPMDLYAPGRC